MIVAALLFTLKKPSNVNLPVSSPETASAEITALGPGITTVFIPRSSQSNQIFARIGNARHSGVRYNCTIFALFNSVADDFATLTLVVFKIAHHRLFMPK